MDLDKFAKKVDKMREAQKMWLLQIYHPDVKYKTELKKAKEKAEYDVDVMLHTWRNDGTK